MSKPSTLVEAFDFRGAVVDRENWVIRGVKVLGRKSRNGRIYEDSAIKDSARLCENLPVTVRGGHDREGRDYHSQNGQLRGGEAKFLGSEKAASYYDWHLNPKDELTEKICYDAEHFPENVPLSHEVSVYEGDMDRDGILHVQRLIEVDGVAAVFRGGTNRSLFEEHVVMDLKTLKAQHGPLVEQLRAEFLAEDTVKAELQEAQTQLAKIIAEKDSLQEKLNETEAEVAKYHAAEQRTKRAAEIQEAAKEVLGKEAGPALLEALLPLSDEVLKKTLQEILANNGGSKQESGASAPESTSGAAYGESKAPVNRIGRFNRQ